MLDLGLLWEWKGWIQLFMIKWHKRKFLLSIFQDFSLVALIQSHAVEMALSACYF